MPTVLSKHRGELFGKRVNVNSHWYICQKGQMYILLAFGLSWQIADYLTIKKFLNIISSISHYLTYEEKNN